MNVTEKLKMIHALCSTQKNAFQISDAVKLGLDGCRRYAAIMEEHGILEHIEVRNESGRIVKYWMQSAPMTDEICEAIREDFAIKTRYRNRVSQQNRIVGEKETRSSNEDNIAREAQGIYLLSSKPSKYFQDKFKGQSSQARREYKSPKNYAGTSAGMVW